MSKLIFSSLQQPALGITIGILKEGHVVCFQDLEYF